MFPTLIEKVRKSIELAPDGIATLDVLDSLRLCDADTLKSTLSRLHKRKATVRLKRGTYASLPIRNAFAAALATFNGYLGFSSALYLHQLISEQPFTYTVVTESTSATKSIGQCEFKAVALKEKAIGIEYQGALALSTRAKTLFDCLYLPSHSIEYEKLIDVFEHAKLSKNEWAEFDQYVIRFALGKTNARMVKAKNEIAGGSHERKS